jgi:hypothetical protein
MVTRLRQAATITSQRNSLRGVVDIDGEFAAKSAGTVHALKNFVSAESIAALPVDDPRKRPLTQLNRIVARRAFVISLAIGEDELMIQDLAMAPQARLDLPWNGNVVICSTNWDSEVPAIHGHTADLVKVEIRLSRRRRDFNKLMQRQARFVSVTGRGYRNEAGLRILEVDSVDESLPDSLPPPFCHFDGFDEPQHQ